MNCCSCMPRESNSGRAAPVRWPAGRAGAECNSACRFEPGEGLLAYSDRSFVGYRLLQEYFHFPSKFFFFDLAGLDAQPLERLGHVVRSSDFLSRFRASRTNPFDHPSGECRNHPTGVYASDQPVRAIGGDHSRVTCGHRVPVGPGPSPAKPPWKCIPVDRVISTAAYSEEPQVYEPFYSFRHAMRARVRNAIGTRIAGLPCARTTREPRCISR